MPVAIGHVDIGALRNVDHAERDVPTPDRSFPTAPAPRATGHPNPVRERPSRASPAQHHRRETSPALRYRRVPGHAARGTFRNTGADERSAGRRSGQRREHRGLPLKRLLVAVEDIAVGQLAGVEVADMRAGRSPSRSAFAAANRSRRGDRPASRGCRRACCRRSAGRWLPVRHRPCWHRRHGRCARTAAGHARRAPPALYSRGVTKPGGEHWLR
jgi:hypothetical protein